MVHLSFVACGLACLGFACSSASPKDSAEDSGTVDPRDSGSGAGLTWEILEESIDASVLVDATVLFGNSDGVQFSHSRGDSTGEEFLLLASASKWLASITILSLVEDGVVALDDHPQDYLNWWTSDSSDSRSEVTLEQLLSFTSGLTGAEDGVPCVEDGDSTIEACAQEIYSTLFAHEPGEVFVYGPAHLQVAGAMVTEATGETFHRLFRNQVGEPLGLKTLTSFGVPSLANPRVAGGALGSAEDYAKVLTALSSGALLSPESMEVLGRDRTGGEVVMQEVPEAATASGEWHYALGCWRECAETPYSADCDQPGVLSSPGMFGFYPMWDTARGNWGVIGVEILDNDGSADITVPLGQEWFQWAGELLEEGAPP